jgi:predicted acylesterase/phospholipase RssA
MHFLVNPEMKKMADLSIFNKIKSFIKKGREKTIGIAMNNIDFVIGVELVDAEEFSKEPTNIFDVILKSIHIMVNETRQERLKFADAIISPVVYDIGQFDFDKIPLLIKRGKEAVYKHIEFIKKSVTI